MLLTCPSCNSKYLVNSADLKPNGRTVCCVKCRFDWYQAPDIYEEEKESINKTVPHTPNLDSNTNKNQKLSVSNLPATYVVDQKPSFINTFLVVCFLGAMFFFLWIIKNENYSLMALTNFYIHEFYFNLKLIINDFAKIIHQMIN